MRRFFRRTKNALNYIRRAEWSEFAKRLHFFVTGGDPWQAPAGPLEKLSWGIITPPHSAYVATLIAKRLSDWGARVEILHESPRQLAHDYYIVLAPQVFKRLPPGRSMYIYQLEQTLSSNWFSKKYLRLLENCRGVLEYKQGNLGFLSSKKIAYPHTYLLPIGGNPDLLLPAGDTATEAAPPQALFYGAWKANPRRRELLSALEKHLPVLRQDNLFAPALYDFIRGRTPRPIVLNLHHYDPAQLETPRLWEAVSLGLPVVSEDSPDGEEDTLLRQAITIAPPGDVPALTHALLSPGTRTIDPAARQQIVEAGWERFCFYFDRFLLSEGYVSPEDPRLTRQPAPPATTATTATIPPRWCLTLPETDERYQAAQSLPVDRWQIGLRKRPGWKGCALSYREIARQALAQGLDALWVVEDDIALTDGFETRINQVWHYLAPRDDWDICVGHLTLVDDQLEIARIERLPQINLLYINQFLGMAANLYHRRALEVMAHWQPEAGDEYNNTIDQFMKSQGLRTVATWPYLVTHDDDHHSTLWGFKNAHYQETIEATRRRLNELCQDNKGLR